MTQFSQQQLESYSMCPHYHDEINDKRDQQLAQNYDMTFKKPEEASNGNSQQMEIFKKMMTQYNQQPGDQNP